MTLALTCPFPWSLPVRDLLSHLSMTLALTCPFPLISHVQDLGSHMSIPWVSPVRDLQSHLSMTLALTCPVSISLSPDCVFKLTLVLIWPCSWFSPVYDHEPQLFLTFALPLPWLWSSHLCVNMCFTCPWPYLICPWPSSSPFTDPDHYRPVAWSIPLHTLTCSWSYSSPFIDLLALDLHYCLSITCASPVNDLAFNLLGGCQGTYRFNLTFACPWSGSSAVILTLTSDVDPHLSMI